jgi:hypothetical protein
VNLHVHFLLTLRRLDDGEFSRLKAREWNRLFYPAKPMRLQIASLINQFCRMHGIDYEADARSNFERGLPPPEPTLPKWNLIAQQRTGKPTVWLGERDEYREARRRLAELEAELEEVTRLIRREKMLAAARQAVPTSAIATFMNKMPPCPRPVASEAGTRVDRKGPGRRRLAHTGMLSPQPGLGSDLVPLSPRSLGGP